MSEARRRSREAALQVLYAVDLAGRGAPPGPEGAEQSFEGAVAHLELPPAIREFARELVAGVASRRDELDERIAAHARNWRIERMAAVDRNILRLAAYETLYTATPTPVVIDEAVELARRFGGERSPAFVNGILDALARAEREERDGAPRAKGGDEPASKSTANGGEAR